MATRLYIGNLAYTVNDQELTDFFGKAGKVVSANVIQDKFSGRSRGFGFVEMESDEEAKKAIEMFNGQDMGGRNIVVNEARPQKERPEGGQSQFGERK